MNDQPTTCPLCGARSDVIFEFYRNSLLMQVNECLFNGCKHVFLEVETESP